MAPPSLFTSPQAREAAPAQLMVVDVEWPVFLPLLETAQRRPLFDRVRADLLASAPSPTSTSTLRPTPTLLARVAPARAPAAGTETAAGSPKMTPQVSSHRGREKSGHGLGFGSEFAVWGSCLCVWLRLE
jgi:hypothetical protein